MKSSYDTLGKYIHPVDVRNAAGKEENLLGVTTQKYFMPSIANTIGTDFSKYKVVKKGQFTYVPDTSRRGDRIAIALLQDWNEGLVSNIYTVFEVINTEKLLPEYLMLWFKRPEFDRYARFKSHGSVREIFDWDEMCKVRLPVPELSVQRSIVNAYNTIERRIRYLRRINDNLEAVARVYFVRFYSSLSDSRTQCLSEICCLASSKRIFAEEYVEAGIPFFRGTEISQKRTGQPLIDVLYIDNKRFNDITNQFGFPQKGDILITAVGTIGNSYMVQDEVFYFKDGNIIWLKDFTTSDLNYFVFDFMQTTEFSNTLETICIGSTQTALTIMSLGQVQIRVPTTDRLGDYAQNSMKLRSEICHNNTEIQYLYNLQSVLLSNLAR
jgi:type I restriction enzyme S subunit